MTVKELIAELQKLDEDMMVVTDGSEERYAPMPRIEKHNFKCHYWDEKHQLSHIPANQEHVVI